MPIVLPEVDCVFCERIAGERDDWSVIEATADTISFVNPAQFEVGQSLVIPRRHAPTLLDLTDGEAEAMMSAVRRLSKAIVDAYDPDGLTIYQNNGVASLQAVPHCHVHVVPRRHGSGWGEGPPHIAPLERAERERRLGRTPATDAHRQVAELIEARLGA
jgi:histidine triad (HIT) family protein